MHMYKTPVQIPNVSNTIVRGKKLRVFVFGDYEFLCKMYGISGASGKIETTSLCFIDIYMYILSSKLHLPNRACRPSLLPLL